MTESYDDEDVWSDDDDDAEGEEGEEEDEERAAPPLRKQPQAIDDATLHSLSSLSSDSSQIALEIMEHLKQTSVDYTSSSASIEPFVSDLAKSLAAIPEQEVRGDSASGFLIDLGCNPDEVNLSFKPPSTTSLIGSYSLHSMTRSSKGPNVVDVAVEVPAECLFKKAYLSYRYHARRALYLSVVSKHLTARGFHRQELCAVKDDPTRPALLLFPPQVSPQTTKKASDRFHVPHGFVFRLILVISHNAFVPSKLGPDRNSIRWVSTTNKDKGKGPEGSASDLAPTPLYNTSLLQEMSFIKHHSFLHKTLNDKSSPFVPSRLSEGLLLLKSWARARDLIAPSCLDGHILAMLLAHLVQGGKVSPLMTSLQIFRCALHSLSDPSGLSKGMSMAREDPLGPLSLPTSSSAHPPSISGFKKHGHPVVFLDPSGWLNLTAGLSASSLAQVAMAAKHALSLLQSPNDPEEAFAAVFLTPTSPASLFDYHWKIQLPISASEEKVQFIKESKIKKQAQEVLSSKKKRKHSTMQEEEGEGDEEGSSKESTGICKDQVAWREEELSLESLIKQALGDRSSLVRVLPRRIMPGQAPLPTLSHGLPALLSRQLLAVARIEASLAMRMVDIGPAADDKTGAAERFRSFWGPKAELRRFQDGKISEAVVWECPPSDRHIIPDKIVAYVLSMRHLLHKAPPLPHSSPSSAPREISASISTTCSCLDASLLQLPPGTSGAKSTALGSRGGSATILDPSHGVSSQRLIESALEALGKQLRSTEGLALKVVGVQPVGAAVRQTCTFVPSPHPLATAGVGSGGLGRFSGGKIPRCMEPIEVLVQLESSGRWPDDPTAFKKTKAALGLQLGMSLQAAFGHSISATEDYVDVLTEGFAFRLLFHSPRDEAMLSKEESTGSTLYDPRRHPIVASWHHGFISAVASTNPAFAPSTRLAKRWLGSQLLSNHLCDEAIELLMAATFTSPSPTPTAPGSRLSGFLRFLDLIYAHPWSSKALFIDPEGQGSKEQRAEAQARYDLRRKASTDGPFMCLCTPRDLDSRHWTWHKPGKPALHQLVTCARRSSDALRSLIESSSIGEEEAGLQDDEDVEWLSATFSPPPGSFDLLITLRDEALPQSSRSLPQGLLFPQLKKRAKKHGLLNEGPASFAPRKNSRAFLRAFPDQVISSFSTKAAGAKELISELLIGFDPVKKFVEALEERFGHLGAFGADYTGGARVVGVKWFPAALRPTPLLASTAHTAMPSTNKATEMQSSKKNKGQVWVEANIPLVLQEIMEIGEGLIEDIVTLE